MFIDTHTHLYVEQFDNDRKESVQRAVDAGVKQLLLPNIDADSCTPLLNMVRDFPGICYPMMGLHPCSVDENYEEQLLHIEAAFDKSQIIAIGEIGIDLYWDKSTLPLQIEAFRRQVQQALQLQLPIVIHARDSFGELFEQLDDLNCTELTGVFHCFTGGLQEAKKIVDYGGFMMGIGGVSTFKNSGLDKVLPEIDPSLLILETDAPYLSPVPYRGKRNESAYIPLIASKLSEIYGISEEEIGKITSTNAYRLFPKLDRLLNKNAL